MPLGGRRSRGFPFEEDEGGAWADLAARHPDIAARLRAHPATWARKRRPSGHEAEDFGDAGFSNFDRFPFDDIPPQFREHLPPTWNRRFGPREDQPSQQPPPQPQSSQPQPPPQQQSAATQTAATQTEEPPEQLTQPLPQYGLRNTFDLGQKSPADPSLVDAEDRAQRSMSAPPESSAHPAMSAPNEAAHESPNVRHIPIFVEDRHEHVINRGVDQSAHFGDTKPAHPSPPHPHPHPHPQPHPHVHPHIDRDQYFNEEPLAFNPPPNFTRSFGVPPPYRQHPGQPFTQKMYPNAFARGASPQRSQSPKPQHQDEFRQIPVHHEGGAKPKGQPQGQPQRQQQQPQQQRPPQQQHNQQQQQQAPQQPPPPQQPPQPPKTAPSPPDPITQILAIQTDVLNLMTEVENFTGTDKKDKKYMYLDEMLTRNLIKLDNIETEGKENIRTARKEAIKCIQKCISVLEAKAENNKQQQLQQQAQDAEMAANSPNAATAENGEVEMKDENKKNAEVEMKEAPKEEAKTEGPSADNAQNAKDQPQAAAEPQVDTRPEQNKKTEEDKKPKKGKGAAKKRDKSKDKKDSDKDDKAKGKEDKPIDKGQAQTVEAMQVDNKAGQTEPQSMDVDATSQ